MVTADGGRSEKEGQAIRVVVAGRVTAGFTAIRYGHHLDLRRDAIDLSSQFYYKCGGPTAEAGPVTFATVATS